jgi:hypothetical protein
VSDNVPLTAGSGETIAADEVVDGVLGTVKVQYVKIMNGVLDASDKIGGDASFGLDVDVTRMPGLYIEDTASAGAESLTLAGAVRQDTLLSSTSATGDYGSLKVDRHGRLYVQDSAGFLYSRADAYTTVGNVWSNLAGTSAVPGVEAATYMIVTEQDVGVATAHVEVSGGETNSSGSNMVVRAIRIPRGSNVPLVPETVTALSFDGSNPPTDFYIVPIIGRTMALYIDAKTTNGTVRTEFYSGPIPFGSLLSNPVHDDAAATIPPHLIGGYASAAAPTSVSADGDAVKSWYLRNGAQATVLTAAGALMGGDATNGLDVDVTRVTGTVTVDSELSAAAALSDTTANPTTAMVGAADMIWDTAGTQWVRRKQVVNAIDTTGVGYPGSAIMAQFDDVSPGTVTENQFSTVRMSSRRALLVEGVASGTVIPISDGSGSLTVDQPTGTNLHTVIDSGTVSTITNVVHVDDNASTLSIDDGAGSITIDGTVTAVDAGDIAHDAADSGNPVKVGAKAANALPTAVANNDRTNNISDLWGRQLTSHIDPAMQVNKAFNATTTQTGTDVWSPTSGKKIAVTSVVIGTYGTTAARLILWFGDNADTTYSAGTDQLLLAASFAPSATSKPGLVFTPAVPVFCTTADRELHCTTDAGISVDIAVSGYEWA